MMWILAAAALGVAAGYVVGRLRVGLWLDCWADRQYGGRHTSMQWILAQPVLGFQIVYWLVVHPRRSLENLVASRKRQALKAAVEPIPVRDPDWASNRARRGEHR